MNQPTTWYYLKLGRQALPTLPRGDKKRETYLAAEDLGIVDKFQLIKELAEIKVFPTLLSRAQLATGKAIYHGDD